MKRFTWPFGGGFLAKMPTFQNVYNSGATGTIQLTDAIGGVIIKNTVTPVATPLQVQNSAAGNLFSVSSAGVATAGASFSAANIIASSTAGFTLLNKGGVIANGFSAGEVDVFADDGADTAPLFLASKLATASALAGVRIWNYKGTRSAGHLLVVGDGSTWAQKFGIEWDGRVNIKTPATAPTDGNLMAASISFYLNEAGNELKARVKYADGTTYKTFTAAIA